VIKALWIGCGLLVAWQAPAMARDDNTVTYDCSWIAAKLSPPPQDCPDPPTGLAEIVEASKTVKGLNMNFGPNSEVWDPIRRLLSRATSLDPMKMTFEERVLAQGEALAIAHWRHYPAYVPPRDVVESAWKLVRRLALRPDQFNQLGDEPATAIDTVLGTRASWIEKRAKQIPLQHESAADGTRAYRPIRIGEMRVLFGQLVGFDTSGAPHVVASWDAR